MGLIFASLIFLLFDINITSYEIDVLPDFLGWILMLAATLKMSGFIKYASYVKLAEIAMIIISVPYEVLAFLPGIRGSAASFVYAILKLLVMTFVLFCLSKIKERLKDKTYFYAARKVWFVVLALETAYFIFAGLIERVLPKSVVLAVTQVIVITLLFAQVLFLIFLRKTQNSVDLK